MVFKPDQQKMQQLLSEAITVLCKNGLNYQSHVNVEALIGITLDDDEVFLVSVKETIQSLKTQQVPLASPTYTTSPAHRQKATPNRKRTTPNAFQASHLSQPVNIVPSDHVVDDERVVDGGEPPAKRLAEVSDVIHIKGEQDEDGEEISETYLDQASANYEEAQDDGGGEQDRNYDTSQLEQFVDFATTSQSSEQDQVDSKAAVFPNQPVPDPTFAISPAIPISSSHQQLNSPATRTPQQSNAGRSHRRKPAAPVRRRNVGSSPSATKGHKTPNRGPKRTQVVTNLGEEGNPGPIVQTTYNCGLCQMSFTSKSSYTQHEKLHMGNFLYHCQICGKGYNHLGNLEGHLATHTNVKAFRCPICGVDFAYKQSFKLHLKQKHEIKDEEDLNQVITSTKYLTSLQAQPTE